MPKNVDIDVDLESLDERGIEEPSEGLMFRLVSQLRGSHALGLVLITILMSLLAYYNPSFWVQIQ